MKRGSDRQLGKDVASDDEPEEAGVFEKATNDEISGRRMFKRGGKKATTPSTVPAPTSTLATASAITPSTTTKSDAERITQLENEVFDLRAQVSQILEKLNMPVTTSTKPSTTEPKKKDDAPAISGSFSFGDTSTNKSDLVNISSSGSGFNFGDSKKEESDASGGFKFGGADSTTTTSSSTPFSFNFGSTTAAAGSTTGASTTFSSFSGQGDSSSFSFSSQSQKDGDDDGVPAWSGNDYEAPDSQPVVEAAPSVTLLHSSEEKVQTGEEEETTLCQFKVKLFELEKKGDAGATDWGERGVGVIKLNEKKDKSSARLLMRKEQVFTLLLNAVIFAEMKCQKPQDKSLLISTFTAGQPVSYLIKFQKAADCDQLKNSIDEIKVRLGGKKE